MDRHQDATFMPTRPVPPAPAVSATVAPFELAAAISEREVWRLATLMVEGYGVAARLWTILGDPSRAEALRSDARTRFRGDPSLALLGRGAR